MRIQAELSLYPLKTVTLDEAIANFTERLMQSGLSVTLGAMSTIVAGNSHEVFRVIAECFEQSCLNEHVVLVAKFSNACPAAARGDGEETEEYRNDSHH